jgi:hypothetical protein
METNTERDKKIIESIGYTWLILDKYDKEYLVTSGFRGKNGHIYETVRCVYEDGYMYDIHRSKIKAARKNDEHVWYYFDQPDIMSFSDFMGKMQNDWIIYADLDLTFSNQDELSYEDRLEKLKITRRGWKNVEGKIVVLYPFDPPGFDNEFTISADKVIYFETEDEYGNIYKIER